MKKLIFSCWLAVAVVAVPVALVHSGCTTPASTTTYTTLAVTGNLVNTAYTAYLDLVIKGKVATNSVPVISAGYNDFQQVYGAALSIAQFNPNAVAPSNVVATANSLVSKINLAQGKP